MCSGDQKWGTFSAQIYSGHQKWGHLVHKYSGHQSGDILGHIKIDDIHDDFLTG